MLGVCFLVRIGVWVAPVYGDAGRESEHEYSQLGCWHVHFTPHCDTSNVLATAIVGVMQTSIYVIVASATNGGCTLQLVGCP